MHFRNLLANNKKQVLLFLAAITLTSFLFIVNLLGITNGSSQAEASLINQSQDLSNLIAEPSLMPLKLLHWIGGWIPGHDLLVSRLISVLLAALSIILITYIIKRWGGKRTALFGFFVVVCSAWLLHVGRSGTTDILFYLALPSLIFSHLLLYDNPSTSRLTAWLAIQSLLLYIPGMFWFVLINIIWQRSEIMEAWSEAYSWLKNTMIVFIPIFLLTPLFYGVILSPANNLLNLAGLPDKLPDVFSSLQRAGYTIVLIGYGREQSSSIWLAGLPILDLFLLAALVAGVVFYVKHWKAFRSRLLLTLSVLALALISLGGPVKTSLLVPILFIVIPTGIAYALHMWIKVFPNNPVIKGLGIGLMSLAVLASCVYNLRSYFIAWPHHQATATAFSHRDLDDPHL